MAWVNSVVIVCFDKNNITHKLYLYKRRFDRKTGSPQKESPLEEQYPYNLHVEEIVCVQCLKWAFF